jgi:hypothetical protein
MAIFASTNELNEVMENLWARIKADPSMNNQLLKTGLIVRFHYREPAGRLTVDCSDGVEMKISTGESDRKPMIEMFMKSNMAHEFWLGNVNVPVSILAGKIVSKGPVNKVLALLPVVKPAYAFYLDVYEGVIIKRNDK